MERLNRLLPSSWNRFWSDRYKRWLPKSIEVYTIQLWKHRRLNQTDIVFVDVTWKSGDRMFAPTAEILFPYKSKMINENEYINAYNQLTYERFLRNPDYWIDLLSYELFAVACYCRADKFCHRYLLIDNLRALCKMLGIEFHYGGEIE